MSVKMRLFKTMFVLALAGIPLGAWADEISPAGDPDFAGFEQLVQDSIEKSRGAGDSNAFGKAISEEARKLNKELAGKNNPVSEAASARGRKRGQDKGQNKVLKEQKKKLKIKEKKDK